MLLRALLKRPPCFGRTPGRLQCLPRALELALQEFRLAALLLELFACGSHGLLTFELAGARGGQAVQDLKPRASRLGILNRWLLPNGRPAG